MNAYLLYSNSIRADVKAENPDFSMGEIVSTYEITLISYLIHTKYVPICHVHEFTG